MLGTVPHIAQWRAERLERPRKGDTEPLERNNLWRNTLATSCPGMLQPPKI